MKALLICPADRPTVADLAHRTPLVTAPLLGRSLIEYWIEHLAARGVRHLRVLAADQPNRIRDHVGDGARWGVQLEVIPTSHELTVGEARGRFGHPTAADGEEVVLLDHLPEQPGQPLFDDYAGWFSAQRAWMARAVTPNRIGVRELAPGIWAGLRAEIAPSARLTAPCWIGDYARIGADAEIGPGAIINDRVVVEPGARVVESIIGPDTLVGKFVSVERSLADGGQLTNWHTNSTVQVPDPYLLADLGARPAGPRQTSFPGRVAAGLAMAATIPFAIGVVLISVLRGESPWQLRLGLRSQRHGRPLATETFAYYELTGARNWLRRWPQFWCVLRGDMNWIGNRPLRPTQALTLANDFERLWLAAPVGLISLADAHGCPDGISDEAMAHASYYAVHANWKVDAQILGGALLRSVLVWPITRRWRKEAAVPLQQLVPKQEL